LLLKYFPFVYRYYNNVLETVCAISPDCEVPFEGLPFQSYTLNVGSKSISLWHRDSENLALGLCLVIPVGSFDHTKGGHLVLHELKLYLELPSGSIALFPSAVITHENVGISEEESRRAITAFSSGSMFQWVENGFCKASEFSDFQNLLTGNRIWGESKTRLGTLFSFF
jgi:hypothetical protein